MIAYHFVGDTLRNGDPIPTDGEWLEYAGPLVMCESGLHASLHPFDALQYAPGATLCLVDCDDIAAEESDKLVCSRRRIVARFDATGMLWEMSRWSALQVIRLWDAPPVVLVLLVRRTIVRPPRDHYDMRPALLHPPRILHPDVAIPRVVRKADNLRHFALEGSV